MKGKTFVGFDLETADAFEETGHRKHISEIGAVKFVYTKAGFKPVDVLSMIVNEGVGVHPDAIEYTGITPKLVEDFGIEGKRALEVFESFVSDADFLVSHNGDAFDIPVINAANEAHGLNAVATPNIDTMTCIKYPNNCKSRNLTYLQAFHGFVNPYPHRAVFDVMAMFKVMEKYDLEDIVANALSPVVRYAAKFSYPNERSFPTREAYLKGMADFNKTKDLVKSLGFGWKPESKQWIYEGKERIFNEDIKAKLTCHVQKL